MSHENRDGSDSQDHDKSRLKSLKRVGVALASLSLGWNITPNTQTLALNMRADFQSTPLDQLISGVASSMAQEDLDVHCSDENFEEADDDPSVPKNMRVGGFVRVHGISIPLTDKFLYAHGSNDIYLRPDLCTLIESAVRQGSISGPVQDRMAVSFQSLSHEIEHTRGVNNESEAECRSLNNLPGQMERLGFDADEGVWAATYVVEEKKSDPQNEYSLTESNCDLIPEISGS